MSDSHNESFRSLFNDMYTPINTELLYENGRILQDIFVWLLQELNEDRKVGNLVHSISMQIPDAEKAHISVMRETKPHENLPADSSIEKGFLYTVDIAFKRSGCWIDGAVCFPCGDISQDKREFWEMVGMQFLKMRNTFKAPMLFKDWIRSSGLNMQNIVENMGGHGIGRELHQEPELIYSDPGNIVLTKDSLFTLEPVFHYGYGDKSIFAYHECTMFYHEGELHFFPDIKKIFFFDAPC